MFSAEVKFISVNPPLPTEYVVLLSVELIVNVLPLLETEVAPLPLKVIVSPADIFSVEPEPA